MAIGFMNKYFRIKNAGETLGADSTRSALGYLCLAMACLWPPLVSGADVGLAGLFPGKALLTINGGSPRIVAVGNTTPEGVKVMAIEGETAILEVDGKRRVLRVGQNVTAQPSSSGSASAVLTADSRGHFFSTGNINGSTVRFLVDTGASMVSIGAADARRLGIDASKGEPGIANTANGQTMVSRVKLNSVRVGDIVLNNVDALVHQHDLPVTLLGMSFLNRMEMQRNGDTMTLIKRY